MSDEVKIGDRFEVVHTGNVSDREKEWRAGDVLVASAPQGDIAGHWVVLNKRTETFHSDFSPTFRVEDGYWRRLPSEQPSLEDRRRGLKPGERVPDVALLKVGDTVRFGNDPPRKWTDCDVTDPFMPFFTTPTSNAPLTFLGWATEEEGESETMKPGAIVSLDVPASSTAAAIREMHDIQMARLMGGGDVVQSSGRNVGKTLAAEQWYSQNAQAYNQPGAAEAYWRGARALYNDLGPGLGYRAENLPAADTQKRHPDCKASHEPRTGCAPCERLIAAEMASQDTDSAHDRALSQPAGRTPYEPRCGDFVGRVMTPVGRTGGRHGT